MLRRFVNRVITIGNHLPWVFNPRGARVLPESSRRSRTITRELVLAVDDWRIPKSHIMNNMQIKPSLRVFKVNGNTGVNWAIRQWSSSLVCHARLTQWSPFHKLSSTCRVILSLPDFTVRERSQSNTTGSTSMRTPWILSLRCPDLQQPSTDTSTG